MTPHTCPNCYGVGQMRYGEDVYISALPMLESCRSCHGTGIVWGPPAIHQPFFFDYYQPPFVTTWSGSDYNMVC